MCGVVVVVGAAFFFLSTIPFSFLSLTCRIRIRDSNLSQTGYVIICGNLSRVDGLQRANLVNIRMQINLDDAKSSVANNLCPHTHAQRENDAKMQHKVTNNG